MLFPYLYKTGNCKADTTIKRPLSTVPVSVVQCKLPLKMDFFKTRDDFKLMDSIFVLERVYFMLSNNDLLFSSRPLCLLEPIGPQSARRCFIRLSMTLRTSLRQTLL